MRIDLQKYKTRNAENLTRILESMVSIKTVNAKMDATLSLMNKASDSSKQITEVIEIWSDITEETTILALNATVQAVKAGDAGKPFKVVADSIQGLAENAGEAARKVGNLLSIVQSNITSANQQVENTTKEVENTVALSGDSTIRIRKMSKANTDLIELLVEMVEDNDIKNFITPEMYSKIKEITEKN